MKTKLLFSKLFLVSFFFLKANFSQAQFVYIPDADFRFWLAYNGYAGCMVGDSLDTTCSLVVNATSINCGLEMGISDLTGIQYFSNLISLDCNSNSITLLPNLPATLTTLICGTNNLTSLPNLPASLTYLDCSSNLLSSLPILPSTLTYLDCAGNQLTSIPSLPASLSLLNFSGNPLAPFPSLPASLDTLYCGSNQLTTLPVLPPNLSALDCSSNPLGSLTGLPASLTCLVCASDSLTSLPALPGLLQTLSCNNNLLTSLPGLPASLINFACGYNQLTSLPTLPGLLQSLSCINNQLSSLPGLPSSLIDLACGYNQLTSLPPLPGLIYRLSCNNNLLTSLPGLPSSLTYLACEYNQLTSLPSLPSLYQLTCNNNQLTSLPGFQSSMHYANISYNPISCLPEIPTSNNLDLLIIDWDSTNISCLSAPILVDDFPYPSLNDLPLCQPSSGCPVFWNIFGKVYLDTNANCIQDTNETVLRHVPVVLDSGGVQLQRFLTNQFGQYAFRSGYGNYVVWVDTASAPYQVNCPLTFFYNSTLTVVDSLDSLMNFGLQCKPGFDLIALGISPSWTFLPGAVRMLYLNVSDAMRFYGTSCTSGLSGSVQAILNGAVSYVSPCAGALTPSSVSGDTITWTVSDFSLTDPNTSFNIHVQVDTSAIIGDTICIQLSVLPTTGDNIPSNNFLSSCFPIRSSCDPNEKYISPSGLVDTSEHWFTFTVFFQNTGNSSAENIYILDTLDQNLDATTFTFLSSSHEVVTQLLPGNILRFNYHNIFLADSTTDEPASHGYVEYKVKRKQNLPVGLTIYNTAYIYFDLNTAVATNQVSATFISILNVSEPAVLAFELFPNPTRDKLTITSSQLKGNKINLEILNVLGQRVYSLQSAINNSQFAITIDVSHFPQGIYFVKVKNEQGASVKKFVKE